LNVKRLLPFAALSVAWCLACAPAQAKMAMCAKKNALWGKFLQASGSKLSDALPSPDFAVASGGYGYETAMGRACWPSPDPIGEWSGMNLYEMVKNDSIKTVDFLGLDPLDDFLNKNLPNRDRSLDAKRKLLINNKQCIGGVSSLCGKEGLGRSTCFSTKTEADILQAKWNRDGTCCKNGEKGPNGQAAKAVIWVLAYDPTPQNNAKNPLPLLRYPETVILPPLLPVYPTFPAFNDRQPRTGIGDFDSGYIGPDGKVKGIEPRDQPYDVSLDEWLIKNKEYKERQFCVVCESNK